jgi:hypothetical protein
MILKSTNNYTFITFVLLLGVEKLQVDPPGYMSFMEIEPLLSSSSSEDELQEGGQEEPIVSGTFEEGNKKRSFEDVVVAKSEDIMDDDDDEEDPTPDLKKPHKDPPSEW